MSVLDDMKAATGALGPHDARCVIERGVDGNHIVGEARLGKDGRWSIVVQRRDFRPVDIDALGRWVRSQLETDVPVDVRDIGANDALVVMGRHRVIQELRDAIDDVG